LPQLRLFALQSIAPRLGRAANIDEFRVDHTLVPDASNLNLDQVTNVELASYGSGVNELVCSGSREIS
jgi:hypothetical protein